MSDSAVYTRRYFLTAGECNAEGHMPLTLLIARLIEGATCHANSLGIGYADLIKIDLAWVLSRVSIEIDHMPGINDNYVVNTWIESTNRMFSERCFSITADDGAVYAMARTTWAAICISTRRPANPGVLGDVMFPTDPPVCAVASARRTPPLPDDARTEKYTFTYCDIDFNRHVNTVRYVGLLLDQWTLDWYDANEIDRFDITFHHECHYGESVDVRTCNGTDGFSLCELLRDGARMVSSDIRWRNKKFKIK